MKEVAIGVDIGGTNTIAGIVDRSGNILARVCFSTVKGNHSIEDYFETLSKNVNGLYGQANEEFSVKGMGIGAPDGNYYSGNIENAANLPWKGTIKVIELCRKYFAFPAVLTNDANAAAIGEMIYGGAIGMKDFIVITIGTGLGSGIVVNGQLLLGSDSFAGEMGHTVIDENGRLCGCGMHGCLETYVSATGIRRTVWELMAKYNIPSAFDDITFSELSAKQISEAAERGDKIALEAFEYTGRILGRKIAEAIAYFSPQAVFLYGGLALAGELILKPVRLSAEKNTLQNFKNKVKILPSAIPESGAAILGAAALVWKEFE